MENKTKMILTAIGLAAVIVPALLLLFFTSQPSVPSDSTVPAGKRQINKNNIEKEVNSVNTNPTTANPSPVPATPTPSPTPKTTVESTSSSQ